MGLLSVSEALSAILARISPLGSERVDLLSATGRVAAEPVVSTRRLPAWDNSAMDGYALRAADVTAPFTTLPIADAVAAGDAGDRPLPPGTAARIFTGAPIPPGADAVVIQEEADAEDGRVTLRTVPRVGDHIRREGSDVEKGGRVLAPGRTLTPGDLALVAAQGRLSVAVHRAPRVAIISSGNELVEIDAGEPGRGQIANTNAWALAAAVRAAGGEPRVLPILLDDRAATEHALRDAAASTDVLLTSGGASVGDHDHVGPVLEQLAGGALAFWKVAIRPGKPLLFGQIGTAHAFGLPGNPISALVTFEVFVRPALLRLAGHSACLRRPTTGKTAAELPAGGPRTEYLRASVRWDETGALHVDARRSQGSGSLSSLAGADAFIVRAAGCAAAAAGDRVSVMLLGPDEPASRLGAP